MVPGGGKLEKNPHIWARSSNTLINQPVGIGFSYAMVSVFSVQSSVITPLRAHRRPVFQGHSELTARDVAIFLPTFFEKFLAPRGNESHSSGGLHVVDFDAIFTPCTLVSHVTGAF
jgi:hypothetical protein